MLSMRKLLTTLNDIKVMFLVESGSCVNLLDEVRFKEIQSRSKSKIKLTKSKIRLGVRPF